MFCFFSECISFLSQFFFFSHLLYRIEQEREEQRCRAGIAYTYDDDEDDDDVFSLPASIAVEEKTETPSVTPASSRRRGQGSSRTQ